MTEPYPPKKNPIPIIRSKKFFMSGLFFLSLTAVSKYVLRPLLNPLGGFCLVLSGSLPSFLIIPTVFFLLWSLSPPSPWRSLLISFLLGLADEGQQLFTAATADIRDLAALCLATGLCAILLTGVHRKHSPSPRDAGQTDPPGQNDPAN